MAYPFDIRQHRVFQSAIIPKYHPAPPDSIILKLTIYAWLFTLHHNSMANLYSITNTSLRRITIDLYCGVLENESRLHQSLAFYLNAIRINTWSVNYDNLVREIMELGLAMSDQVINRGDERVVLPLRVNVLTHYVEHSNDDLRSVLEDSETELERRNYGMVAAKGSSIEEMLKKVRIEDDTYCMVCLEKLKVRRNGSYTANIYDHPMNEWMSLRADKINRSSTTILLHWDKPQEGWHKINTDASWNKRINLVGAGGVIRDNLGNWVAGCMIKLGECSIYSVLEAELWGIFCGLKLAWDKGLRKVELETDSVISVSMIIDEDGVSDKNPLFGILNAIRQLKNRDWRCIITYIPREKNMVADSLAKTSLDGNGNLIVLDSQSASLHSLMLADSLGVCYSRVVKL